MLVGKSPRRATDRRHLVAQEVAVLEAEPDAALAEERVRLVGHRQVRTTACRHPTSRVRRVIRRPVHGLERSRRTRPAAPRPRATRSGRGTGTPCAPARRRPPRPRARHARRRRTRGWRPRRRRCRRGRPPAAPRGRAAEHVARPLPRRAARYSSSISGDGSTCSSPVAAVEEHRGAFGDGEHLRAGRHDDRDVTGPGQDRRVRRRTALGEDDPGDQAQVQARPSRRASGRWPPGHPSTVIRRAGSPVSARRTWSPTAWTSAARSLR